MVRIFACVSWWEKTLEISKIQNFLDELYVKYTLHTNVVSDSTFQFSMFAASINACAVKAILFSDLRGPALVVFPAKHGLDFETLAKVTNRNSFRRNAEIIVHMSSIRERMPNQQELSF